MSSDSSSPDLSSADSSKSDQPQVDATPPVVAALPQAATPASPTVMPPTETQPTTGLAEPSFLHPSSIVFEVVTQIRQYIVPAILGLFGAASGNAWGVGLAGFFFAISLIKTLLRYFTLRYRIENGEFILTEGLLFRRVRSVPIRRIQNMDLVQNVLHRMFGVAVVNIETASGSEPEATLRVLTQSQIDQLRHAIFGNATAGDEATAAPHGLTSSGPDVADGNIDSSVKAGQGSTAAASAVMPRRPTRVEAKLLLTIPLRHLLLAGLTSNRGWVLLSVLIGLYFQNSWGGDWESGTNWRCATRVPSVSSETVQAYLPEQIAALGWIAQIALAVLALWLILRIVGVAWYILRFQGYRLTRQGDDLRIACGLFTKVSASIPRRRIQFISVHRPLLMRLLGLASVRIETAGGGGQDGENAATTVSRRWFIPVIAEVEVWPLLGELRPELLWPTDDVQWQSVSPRTGRRLLRTSFLLSLLVAAAGLAITRPWGFVLGLAIFPILAWIVRKKAKARRFAKLPWGVAYHNGLLHRKLSFAFFDRLQTLGWTQSPFDRRWKMASLYVDTAAAGPAEHLIHVDYLDEAVAEQQFRELQHLAAEHTPIYA